MSRFRKLLTGVALAAAGATPALAAPLDLGRPALPEEVAAWNLTVMPDGTNLPDGQGSVADGEELFVEVCASCHGEFAEGVGRYPALAGGEGTLSRADPVKTVGSFWPYLSTAFDYIHRSMPYGNAGTLTPDETYAVLAYILYSNDLVDDDFVLTKENFTSVKLPNADGFIKDDRDEVELAEFQKQPCMENCKESVEVTKRAANLDVTPGDPGDDNAGAVSLDGGADPLDSGAEAGTEDGLSPEGVAAADAATPTPPPGAANNDGTTEAPAEGGNAVAPDAAAPAAAPAAAEGPTETTNAPAADGSAAAAPAAASTDVAAAGTPADPALIAAGEKVFGKCKACHQVGEGAKNRVGPVLNGVVGRAAAAVEGFKYSKAMVDAGAGALVWDSAALHKYLADPKGTVPGTKMTFAGLKKPQDIDAVIAFLSSHP